MQIQPVTTNKIPPSPNPFSLGIKANGFLFISGQVGKDSTGKIVDGFAAQVKQAMENLKVIIEAAGCSMDKIVKVNVYVTDITKMPELNDIYRQYFPQTLPARAAMEVSRLGLKAEVEIDAIALVD
jgi:2-iminobutanoate/2-iminopropanoate deaminase